MELEKRGVKTTMEKLEDKDVIRLALNWPGESYNATIIQSDDVLEIVAADHSIVFGRTTDASDVIFYTAVCGQHSVFPLLTRVDNGDSVVGYYIYGDPDDMDCLIEALEHLGDVAEEVHRELAERCAVAGRVN